MTSSFSTWAAQAFGHAPYAWQAELAASAGLCDRQIHVPTGFGKTEGALGAWLHNRVQRADAAWPLRLVWCLPMRTLVEQTIGVAQAALGRAGLAEQVGVHALLGGADAGDWHLRPERPAVLVGTQDMLLSRALNRGYGAGRARWPIDFGLLSQDALWVLDEVQLMGVGFATALQLAVHHGQWPSLRPRATWAMSATLQPGWFTVSPDTAAWGAQLPRAALSAADRAAPLWAQTSKQAELRPAPMEPKALAGLIAERRAGLADHATTLVICNTVDAAVAVFEALKLPAGVDALLLHSRFRGADRAAQLARLAAPVAAAGRVIVATQVVEAGVDLSADLLITELCPWPSLVQRLGRLARRGGAGRALIVPLPANKEPLPYTRGEVDAAHAALSALCAGGLAELSPRALATFEDGLSPERRAALYPFDPPHLLLADELDELFDTTADLSGGDVDVSRFIREGEDRDISVFWGPLPEGEKGKRLAPAADLRPGRDGLCAVPVGKARDWLFSKAKGAGSAFGRAFVWDYLDGAWRVATERDLRPGVTLYVDEALGGYRPTTGFDARAIDAVPPIAPLRADAQERADSAQDHDDLSVTAYQTVAFHGGAVAQVAAELGRAVGLDPALVDLLALAGRWHDLGKVHPAFQGAIAGSAEAPRPARADLAKAPGPAWRQGRDPYRFVDAEGHEQRRPGFRHELASTLAMFAALAACAPADHPARLGPWAALLGGNAPTEADPGPLERELLALSAEDFNLVAFLVCAHHGKLRARLHAAPADQRAALRRGDLPVRGVYDGEALPAAPLMSSDGALALLAGRALSLDPARLGLSPRTGASWTERVDALRDRLGPGALAFLEALLRAADVRASADTSLRDPALAAAAAPEHA